MGCAPNLEQASFQLMLREGADFTRIAPPTASRSVGWALSEDATFSNSWARASTAARRAAELTPPMVVLPPEPPDEGYWLSPISRVSAFRGRPSESAATMRMAVRVPTPKSWVPIFIFTEPSGWMVRAQLLLWPLPPKV